MKAVRFHETGGPEVLIYEEVPDPIVGPEDILIRVEAVSIEGGDTLNRLQGALTRSPHIVGYQCAGPVLAIGEKVTGIAVGDFLTFGQFPCNHRVRSVRPYDGFSSKSPESATASRPHSGQRSQRGR